MDDRIDRLTEGLERRAGASQALVRETESRLGVQLPSDYVHFLAVSDGAEGFVGGPAGPYLVLWPIEQLPGLNEGYQVNEFAPGLLLIGSDGGGEAYAFDLTSEPMSVLEIPFIPMDRAEARVTGNNFTEFLEALHRRTDPG